MKYFKEEFFAPGQCAIEAYNSETNTRDFVAYENNDKGYGFIKKGKVFKDEKSAKNSALWKILEKDGLKPSISVYNAKLKKFIKKESKGRFKSMIKKIKEGYYYNSEGEECDPEDIGYQRIDYSDNDEDIGYSEDHNYKLSYNKYEDIYWIERYNPEYDSWTKIDYTKPEDDYLDTLLDKYNIVFVLKESVKKGNKNMRKFKEYEETFYDVFEDEDIDSLFNGNADFKVASRDLQLISGADQFATFKEDGFAGYEFVLTTRDGSKQYEVEVQFYRDDSCTDNVIIRDSNNEIIGEFALKRDCPAWAARNKIVAWLNGNKHYVENKMTVTEKRAYRKGYLKGLKEAKDIKATAVNEIANTLEDYGYNHLTIKDYNPYYVYLPFKEPSHGLGQDYEYFKKTVERIADKYNLYCEIEVDKSRNGYSVGVSTRLY